MKKRLTAFGVVAGMIFLAVLAADQVHGPGIWTGTPLPPGKVTPQFVCDSDSVVLLAPDGSLWAWGGAAGFNPYSLMNVFPSPASFEVPQWVGSDSDWSRVAGSMTHTVALKRDGSLWAWGLNGVGQVGKGDFRTNYGTPIRIGTETNWSQICAGINRSLAIKNDGSLWGWGYNNYGQLGDGTTNNRAVPTLIGVDRDWQMIAAGGFISYAIKSNGTLWCWGKGAFEEDWAPRQIAPDTNWVAISAHDFTMLALRADGTLWLKSGNAHIAAPAFVANPTDGITQIGTGHDWAEIYPSINSFFVRKKDGSWWGCGSNPEDQFGLGTNVSELASPQRLPFTFDPWAFGPEGETTLLLAKDGKLWTWGEPLGTVPPNAVRREINSFLNPVVRRFPSLAFLMKSDFDIDRTPRLLWELPPEVRRSLQTGQGTAANNVTTTHLVDASDK
jgi:alpha-tubulin suppressor-like RCC1 family protein